MSVSDKVADSEAEDTSEVTNRKKVWPQHLAASLATLSAACAGAVDGWTAAGLPYLQEAYSMGNNSTEIPGITYDEASWIGSLSPLGSLFGAIPAGYISNAFGRKCVLLLLSLPMLVGWLMIVFAERSIPLLYTARFIQGFTCGVVTVASPLYNEEIAEVSIRGALGVYLDLMFNVGILYVYIVGAALPYLWMSIASCAIPILFAITFIWMPESPIYLLAKGKDRQAEKALRWLRRGAEERELEVELKQMQQFVRSEGSIHHPAEETSFTSIFTPATVKAMYIIFGLMIFRQLCGMNAVLAYTVDIFIEAGGQMSPYVSTVIVGVVQLVATYIPYFLVDCAGRRILLIISDVGMAVCLLAMVVHFYLLGQGVKLMIMNWVPLIAVNVYILTFSVGFGPLPWFMMPELLSNQAKGWVSSVAVCLNWALAFVVTKFFPVMNHDLGPAATYGTCFLICVLGTIFVAVFVPETKGKTREEIQLQLSGNSTAV